MISLFFFVILTGHVENLLINKIKRFIHSFFCTGILEEGERERERQKKERGSNKLLHTPIEHEIIKKKGDKIVVQQVAMMRMPCNTR